ncbi:MAG: ATP-binding protein [Planctomycetota bacterium]|jgi:DNA-binding response OmpR family regulator
MRTVTAQDIADRVAQATGLAPDAGLQVLNAAMDVMREELVAGSRVVLPNLISLQMSPGGTLETEVQMAGAAGPAPLAAELEPTLRAAAAGTGLSKILLVVPIKDMFMDIIAQRLGGPGKQVAVAEGLQRAVQILEEMKPDLVIIDGNLPDTEQAIREVKLDRSRGLMALIAIYPEGVDPGNVKGVHVCEDEAIQEPYDMEDLVKLADSELQRIAEERMFFEQEVHFQFQTAEEWVEQANDLMAGLVEQAQIDEEKAAALSVAFREAVDNAARHTIYLLDKQKATVTVEDEGDGFDTELYLTRGLQGNAVAAARERNQAGRVGGLGIMLMLKCLDDLEYNYVGNLIKLTKYR